MKITEAHLRQIVRTEILRLHEAGEDKPMKAGSETSSAEGTLDVKKMADILGVDAGKLKTAVANLRADKRNSTDDKVFGDMVAKLIDASPDNTVKVMGLLKKVSSEKS